MRRFFLLLLNSCLCLYGFSQDYHKIDSLKKVLYTTREDTIKGIAIWNLVDNYMHTKPDTGLYYANLGLSLIKDDKVRNDFNASKNPLLYSFEIRMYAKGAVACSLERNDSLALKLVFKALQLAEKSKDKLDVFRVYYNVSDVYSNIGEPDIAIRYMKKAMLEKAAFSQENKNFSLGLIGENYYQLGEYDSALYYFNKVYSYFHSNKVTWALPDYYLAKIYSDKGDNKSSLNYLRKSITIAKFNNSPDDLSRSYLALSEVFNKIGSLDSSIFYAKQSLEIAKESSFPTEKLKASLFLSSLFESKGIIDSAFKYQKLSMVLKDSLFNKEKIKQVQSSVFNEELRQREHIQQQKELRNKQRFYLLLIMLFVFLTIALMLYRNNRQKQKANLLLEKQKEKVESALLELKSTQAQLIQSEKMASLGELTAGIAHEIQNPLNFVNNFSEINSELIEEVKTQKSKLKNEELDDLLSAIADNEEKINHHGKRADAIVKNMLQHSRKSSGVKEPTDINALCDEYLRLAYHGMRAKNKSFNAEIKTDFDKSIGKINIVPQDIGRVLLNIINNAFYATSEKLNADYKPLISVQTKKVNDKIEIKIADNGNGIPESIKEKIFQPFFTTKPTGEGTGLGLSLAYDIITKEHNGTIEVESNEGEGSEFVIQIPIHTS